MPSKQHRCPSPTQSRSKLPAAHIGNTRCGGCSKMAQHCHERGQSPSRGQQRTRSIEPEPLSRNMHALDRHTCCVLKRDLQEHGAAAMSAWTCNGTAAAMRRMAALQCAVGTSANGVTTCRLPPRDNHASSEVRRKRLCAVVLAVLVAHGLLVVEMHRAMMRDTTITQPRVLDIQFRMQDLIPQSPGVAQQPAALPQENAARPAVMRPRTPSSAHSPNDAKARRHVSEPQRAMPSADVARPKPSSATHAPVLAQSSTDNAVAQTLVPSTVAPPSAPPLAQPLTEPSFGAAYLHNPAPVYPAVALQRGWQGTVLLKVHVLTNGRPDRVALLSTSGHSSLDDAAAEAVADWSFVPARRGAQTVDGWVQVPIDFKLGS